MQDTRYNSLPVVLTLMLLLAVSASAWEYHVFDLPSGGGEATWRDALAEKLGGKAEVPVEGGRIDVLTDTRAIEIDWPHKWHEGLGQALHYADATGKQGVLALISYSRGPEGLHEKSQRRFDMVDRLCRKNNIELLVLFPNRPREIKGTRASTQKGEDGSEPTADKPKYWLNTRTGVRHNPGCRFYEKTEDGYYCGPDEGKPCSICGG